MISLGEMVLAGKISLDEGPRAVPPARTATQEVARGSVPNTGPVSVVGSGNANDGFFLAGAAVSVVLATGMGAIGPGLVPVNQAVGPAPVVRAATPEEVATAQAQLKEVQGEIVAVATKFGSQVNKMVIPERPKELGFRNFESTKQDILIQLVGPLEGNPFTPEEMDELLASPVASLVERGEELKLSIAEIEEILKSRVEMLDDIPASDGNYYPQFKAFYLEFPNQQPSKEVAAMFDRVEAAFAAKEL